jgi:hypothetical protein
MIGGGIFFNVFEFALTSRLLLYIHGPKLFEGRARYKVVQNLFDGKYIIEACRLNLHRVLPQP